MKTIETLIALLTLFACSASAIAQSFAYTAQQRSIYARANLTSDSKTAPDFAPWINASVTVISGREAAGADHSSRLDSGAVSFNGQVRSGPITSGTTNAKGVFDVTFTLTAATQVEFFWFTEAHWNLTLWTPTTTRILATAAQSGKNANESLFFEAGTYRLRADSDVSNGAAGNAAYVLTIVPAPTSLAVLGAVGLLAARRRR